MQVSPFQKRFIEKLKFMISADLRIHQIIQIIRSHVFEILGFWYFLSKDLKRKRGQAFLQIILRYYF